MFYQYDIISVYDYISFTAFHLAFKLKVNFNPFATYMISDMQEYC